MNYQLQIPESYKQSVTVAVRGLGTQSDIVICTNDKKILTFFKSCLIKNCIVNIIVNIIEPFIVYEPKIEYYYILHGENKVVIVKEESELKIVKTYNNVNQMIVFDKLKSGVPQLYLKFDGDFECINDFYENNDTKYEQQSKNQEISNVYSFCMNKLQKLQLYSEFERTKLSQKTSSLYKTVKQYLTESNLSFDLDKELDSSLAVIVKYPWLKLNNEKLIFGFTIENKSKIELSNFNVLLLKNGEEVWPNFWYKCWSILPNNNVLNFHSGNSNNFSFEGNNLYLKPETSVIVTCLIHEWGNETLPYVINVMLINDTNQFGFKYKNVEKYHITSTLFMSKEFGIFFNNSILVEDLLVVHYTKFLSSYEIKCLLNLKDITKILIDNFKFNCINEWFFQCSLNCFKSIVINLQPVSQYEYKLLLFSDSLVSIKMFIQLLTKFLPDHTNITKLNGRTLITLNKNILVSDLKELRSILKEFVAEEVIIPREKWNVTRLKLMIT
ncbi:uncharacterized protein LOC126905775 [Daktulosphaira vitifoliae]|uniref:uncharacterized protein LOC126905775 n=1 Tax=Daktulosphaira vitifoliae TaxID=58002 RepID=UPI0021AA044A|nr:uncharacterized protein LOC126905775 [Daktulosphaira vitifoliae]